MSVAVERRFERVGMGYRLVYPIIDTELRCDAINRRSDGLYADLTVTTNLAGARTIDGLMHAARINLMATSTRTTVGKFLAGRVDGAKEDALDWVGMVNELCMRVAQAEAEPEPVEWLNGAHQGQTSKLLLRPFLPIGMPTVLFGDGMAGKSLLAMAMALSVSTGRAIIPGLSPVRTGPVLYLDWETDASTADARQKAICAGAGISAQKVAYRRCRRPLAESIESVARLVDDEKIAMLVVDSMTMAMGTGREGASLEDAVLRFYSALGVMNVTTLIIDHVAKGSDGTKPYGSVFRSNWARATWNLRRVRDDADGTHIVLSHEKHNTTRKFSPVGLVIDWGDDADDETPKVVTIRQEPFEYVAPKTHAEKIAAVLAGGPLRVKEISERTGLDQRHVSVTLGRDDRFEKIDTGDWRLV